MSDAVTQVLDQMGRECGRALDSMTQADGVLGVAAFDLNKVIRAEAEAGTNTQSLETVRKRITSAQTAGQRFREAIHAIQSAVDAIH